MMRAWTKLLPTFAFLWLARRHCPLITLGGHDYHEAAPDILVLRRAALKEDRP